MNKVTIRASSMAGLFDCAYRWEGEHLLGFTKESNGRMHLGTALHEATATMDSGKMKDISYEVDEVLDMFDNSFNHQDYDVNWRYDDLNKNQAEGIGMLLSKKYYLEVTKKTTFSQVEKQIEPVVIEVERYDIAIELTGKLDRGRTVVGPHDDHGIVDLKSGKLAVNPQGYANTKGHAVQIGVYELLDEVSSDYVINLPAKIIGLKTSQTPVIGEGLIYGAKDRLIGNDNQPGYIEMAAQMLSSGMFPPNTKSMLCNKKYCSRWDQCPYKDD